MKSLADKMRLKPAQRVVVLNRPDGFRLEHDAVDYDDTTSIFHNVLCFVTMRAELEAIYPSLKEQIEDDGIIWIAWPKAKQLGTDLNLDQVIKVIYPLGMVESVNLAIDDVWTALKFTWPKPGKTYRNHHATLIRDPKRNT